MQAHAGYRLHFMVEGYALRTARQHALYADGLRHKALKALARCEAIDGHWLQ